LRERAAVKNKGRIWWRYSKFWFNTPRLAAAQRPQRLRKFGIKPDGIINFLSNEPPFEPMQRLRYRAACRAEAHFKADAQGILPFAEIILFPPHIPQYLMKSNVSTDAFPKLRFLGKCSKQITRSRKNKKSLGTQALFVFC
jgi:hypothetical protein